ncbi:MAG: protein kinase, partial [Rivularia sp. (in: cyanobacteria)]
MLTDTILRNRYKILKELGRGGFSVTYLSVDMDLPGNPKCVVKQLKTRHSNNTILQIAKKLFDREAQVLYRLGKGHKQIPEMFAHFEENDEFYLVQEFVDGHDLTKEIKPRHRLSEEKVIKLLEEILEVLSFVHENNVIHRDIKLRNIMRRREDGKIVLIDFGAVKEIKGLAKNQQGDVNSTLIIGTPGYMPDEQANGKPRLCSDVYAVGMLGIQALTGKSPRELPFDPNTGELIWRDSANVSDLLAEVLTGMVRHHFSQRYQTAAAALIALRSPIFILPNTSVVNDAPPVTLPSTIRKTRPAVVQSLGLAGLMGIGFGLGVFGLNFLQSRSNPSQTVTTEAPTTTQKINPSTTPKANIKLDPQVFSPSMPQKEGTTKPVFSPFFIPFFNDKYRDKDKDKDNLIKSTPKPSQSKVKKKVPSVPVESIPKPSQQEIKPTPKTPIVKEENPNQLLTPESKEDTIPTLPPKPESKKEDTTPTLPPKPESKVKQEEDTTPTSLPATSESPDKEKEDTTPTSLPATPEVEDKENDEDNQNPQTSLPESGDKQEKPQPQTPSSPNTPAIEDEFVSPKPTPSPVQTKDSSVVIPITSETPVENSSYYLTVPTSPSPNLEAEIQPIPQPTSTPEAQIQPIPQPTSTPEAKVEPTPQASASPTPDEIEITPQAPADPIP